MQSQNPLILPSRSSPDKAPHAARAATSPFSGVSRVTGPVPRYANLMGDLLQYQPSHKLTTNKIITQTRVLLKTSSIIRSSFDTEDLRRVSYIYRDLPPLATRIENREKSIRLLSSAHFQAPIWSHTSKIHVQPTSKEEGGSHS